MYCKRSLVFRFLKWLEIPYDGQVSYATQKETIGKGLIKGKSNNELGLQNRNEKTRE